MKGPIWLIIAIVGGLLLTQTLAAGQSCADPSFSGADDVTVGYCYATQLRDSGSILLQFFDTINFDMMKLTGQHHPWAQMFRSSSPRPAPFSPRLAPSSPHPTLYRVWIKQPGVSTARYNSQPAPQIYAQHLTWNECWILLGRARRAYGEWRRNGGTGWPGTETIAFGPPEVGATCRPE